MYLYDFKKEKEITSRAKYYFSDNWVRNSLTNFNLDTGILIENLIYNFLLIKWYSLYWWVNWKFEFDFYGIKKDSKIFVHISKSTTKSEVKKEVKKLLKIKQNAKKYLIVSSISDIWMKKLIFDNVEVLELSEFFNRV
jgi:predicted AAA+ superfamily ATPase